MNYQHKNLMHEVASTIEEANDLKTILWNRFMCEPIKKEARAKKAYNKYEALADMVDNLKRTHESFCAFYGYTNDLAL